MFEHMVGMQQKQFGKDHRRTNVLMASFTAHTKCYYCDHSQKNAIWLDGSLLLVLWNLLVMSAATSTPHPSPWDNKRSEVVASAQEGAKDVFFWFLFASPTHKNPFQQIKSPTQTPLTLTYLRKALFFFLHCVLLILKHLEETT